MQDGPMHKLPLLVVSGPTACGKTRIAVQVAEAVGGEIINADSMQVYRHMDIGTAKPTSHQRQRVRFHLVDIVEPDEAYSVADFQADVRRAAVAIVRRNRLPILCGGTTLYVRAVIHHLRFPPPPSDRAIRRRLEHELARVGAEEMHARLAQVDPEAAERIHVNDHKRIVRALEVWESTGRPISDQQTVDAAEASAYNAATFVLTRPRAALYDAIERRVEEMLQRGWVEEVRRLVAQGYRPDLQSMQALGYRWLLKHIRGELDLGEATRLIERDTRRFAKRQLTWFRSQPGFEWLLWTDETDLPPLVTRLVREAERLKGSQGTAQ
jgi:tRNA dimethylallyltransferase